MPDTCKINQVLLSLGANLGDRRTTLSDAVEALRQTGTLQNITASSFYETEPFGVKEQPAFLNIAISGYTALSPHILLLQCKSLEAKFGRQKRERWHERELDIDIIYFGNEILDTPRLTIPHPQATRRNFVLVPIAEIAPDFVDPNIGITVRELRDKCSDECKVTLKTH